MSYLSQQRTNRLQKERFARGFSTCTEVAKLLDISQQRLSNIECGRYEPSIKISNALARLYQVEPITIMDWYYETVWEWRRPQVAFAYAGKLKFHPYATTSDLDTRGVSITETDVDGETSDPEA